MIRKKWDKRHFIIPLLISTLSISVHARMYIAGTNTSANGEESPRLVSLGSGSDGPFNASTYANFGTVGGGIIVLNLNAKNIFNFTEFVLESGYVIQPVGNQPLIIKSLGDVRIKANAGIRCSGTNGQIFQNGANAIGGTGRCGGGRGGSGIVGANGENGVAGGAEVSGGSGGTAQTSPAKASGGGGGGGYFLSKVQATNRSNGSGTGSGVAGTENSNDILMKTTLGKGGSGGGGGGSNLTTNDSGGGGGGGGGTVEIFAQGSVILEADTSFISVVGGVGGDGNSVGDGSGAGGGGSGGTIFVVAGDQVITQPYPGGGVIESGLNADNALGGSFGDADRSGGNGSRGRVWVIDSDCDITMANTCGTDSSIFLPIDVKDNGAYPAGAYGKSIFLNEKELEFQGACGRIGNSFFDGSFIIFLLWLVSYMPRRTHTTTAVVKT
ncbi:MAG: hypothetical protein A4S09_11940 [Proteobacteria bacterium SG_bin7]|nr:MAG: hypothetical protein A4S09_11940 [Proteobacteria bacterium SG_bin7]